MSFEAVFAFGFATGGANMAAPSSQTPLCWSAKLHVQVAAAFNLMLRFHPPPSTDVQFPLNHSRHRRDTSDFQSHARDKAKVEQAG